MLQHVTGVLLRSLYPASCHRSASFGSKTGYGHLVCLWLGKFNWHFSRICPSTLLNTIVTSHCNDVAAVTPILDLCIAAALRRRGLYLIPTVTLQDMFKRILRESWSVPRVGRVLRLPSVYWYIQRHPRLFYMPTWSASEPPLNVTLLDGGVRMILHVTRLGIVLRHSCVACHRGARWDKLTKSLLVSTAIVYLP